MKGRAHQRKTGVTQGSVPPTAPQLSGLMCLLLEMVDPWSCCSQWGVSPTLGCSARKNVKSRAGVSMVGPSRLAPWKDSKQCFPLNFPFHVCILLNKNDFISLSVTYTQVHGTSRLKNTSSLLHPFPLLLIPDAVQPQCFPSTWFLVSKSQAPTAAAQFIFSDLTTSYSIDEGVCLFTSSSQFFFFFLVVKSALSLALQ